MHCAFFYVLSSYTTRNANNKTKNSISHDPQRHVDVITAMAAPTFNAVGITGEFADSLSKLGFEVYPLKVLLL